MDQSWPLALGSILITSGIGALGFLIRKWIGNIENDQAAIARLLTDISDRVLEGATRLAHVEAWQDAHDKIELARALGNAPPMPGDWSNPKPPRERPDTGRRPRRKT